SPGVDPEKDCESRRGVDRASGNPILSSFAANRIEAAAAGKLSNNGRCDFSSGARASIVFLLLQVDLRKNGCQPRGARMVPGATSPSDVASSFNVNVVVGGFVCPRLEPVRVGSVVRENCQC